MQGLLAIGARQSNVSDSGLESYDEIARGIADQVVDEQHRATYLGCTPHDPKSNDDACARSFFSRVGPMLYRRPLTRRRDPGAGERGGRGDRQGARLLRGLSLSLAEMLISPHFLFRYKIYEPDPEHPGQERLDAYSKASELSFFLWNTTPDEELLKSAAERRDPDARRASNGRSIA